MTPNDPTPLIDYRGANVQTAQPIEVRQDGPDTVIVIGPASAVRLMLAQLIPIGALVLVLLLLVLVWLSTTAAGSNEANLLALPFACLIALLLFLLARFIPVARFGRTPAVFRASSDGLLLSAPMLGRRGRRVWARVEVVDITVRHAGAFPAVLRLIRVQVATLDDRYDVVLIPSPGGESLIVLEDALRDSIGLPAIPR